METLHDNNDDAVLWIVKPCPDRVVEPLDDFFSSALGIRLICLQRIINNDKICSQACESPFDRGRITDPVFGCFKIRLCIFVLADHRMWEQLFEPIRLDD